MASPSPTDGERPADSGTSDEHAATAPVPLTGIVSVPSFPVDSLPAPVAAMVRASPKLPRPMRRWPQSGLSALAACAGGHAEIEIRPGWREPLCLYTARSPNPANANQLCNRP